MSRKNNSAKSEKTTDRTSIYVAIIGLIGTIILALISLLNTRTQVLLPISLTQTASTSNTQTSLDSSEDFSSDKLDDNWLWIDPLGDSRNSLTASPGKFRILVSGTAHGFWGDNFNAPRLMQNLSENFVIETKVYANPTIFYQGAGLLIHLDNTKWVKLQIGNLYGQTEVYMFHKNQTPEVLVDSVPVEADSVSLRLERCDEKITGFVSTDGVVWQEINTISFPVDEIVKAGISAENDNQAGDFVADFDFLKVGKCT